VPGEASQTGKRHVLAWVIDLLPAGVLFYAVLMKGLDPLLFADQITAHEVSPASWSLFLAYFFIAVELLLALALLLHLWPRVTHGGFILLMLCFIVVTAIAWAHGNAEECGCFGRTVGRGPLLVIIQDAVLIALTSLTAFWSWNAQAIRWTRVAFLLLLPFVLAFTAIGAYLPADGWVTGVRPGADLADLPIELPREPYTKGTILLILVDEACTECTDALPRMNEIAKTYRGGIRVAAVYSGNRAEAAKWRMQQLPTFPVVAVTPRVLRAYYRRLPVSFLLNEGKVVRAYWGRIPTAAELSVIDYD